VRQIEISVFVHATEDRSKVVKAVRNLFPRDSELPNYSETKLKGFFGDPIILIRFMIKKRKLATKILAQSIQDLTSTDYFTLLDELLKRFDDTKNIYLRFDKQKAFSGKLLLNQRDAIKLKVSIIIPHNADPYDFFKEYIKVIREPCVS
jgi:RNA binding exosome subunit